MNDTDTDKKTNHTGTTHALAKGVTRETTMERWTEQDQAIVDRYMGKKAETDKPHLLQGVWDRDPHQARMDALEKKLTKLADKINELNDLVYCLRDNLMG